MLISFTIAPTICLYSWHWQRNDLRHGFADCFVSFSKVSRPGQCDRDEWLKLRRLWLVADSADDAEHIRSRINAETSSGSLCDCHYRLTYDYHAPRINIVPTACTTSIDFVRRHGRNAETSANCIAGNFADAPK